jgi:hypothetical protein
MPELTRTVMVPSFVLTEKKLKTFRVLVDFYEKILVKLVDKWWRG